jgi:L-lactate dehydrogenase complex protein LldG
MTTARDRILRGLRRRRPGPQALPDNPVRRFDWSAQECLQRFTARIEAVRGEVHRVDAGWPQKLYGILRRKGARNLLYAPDTRPGAALLSAWPERGGVRLTPMLEAVESCRDALFGETDAALTGCLGAVAETGSLVIWPTPQEPRLMSLVPPIHAVLLEERQIRSTFHELIVEQGWAGRGMPTNALLISGPSKSADIEQTLAYGVHGPRELIVLVRGDLPDAPLDAP